MNDILEIEALRDEIARMLAAALKTDVDHEAELQRRDERHEADSERRDQAHLAETARRDEAHLAETVRRDVLHVDEMALLATAIESRDTIGQAKGVIVATMGCSSDEAFRLLKEQSQHENRKLVEIAVEIVERAQRQHRKGGISGARESPASSGSTAAST